MNKLNKIRLGVSALLLAFAAAAPLGVAWQTGSLDTAPAAQASPAPAAEEPAPLHAPPAPPAARDEETIVLDEVRIGAPRPRPAAAKKAPCREADEGTRDLVQGRGQVRTFTFCH